MSQSQIDYLRILFGNRLLIPLNEFIEISKAHNVNVDLQNLLTVKIVYNDKILNFVFLGSEEEFLKFIDNVLKIQQYVCTHEVKKVPTLVYLLNTISQSLVTKLINDRELIDYVLEKARELNLTIYESDKIYYSSHGKEENLIKLGLHFDVSQGFFKQFLTQGNYDIKVSSGGISVRAVRPLYRMFFILNKDFEELFKNKFKSKRIIFQHRVIWISFWRKSEVVEKAYLIIDNEGGLAILIK